MEVIVVRGKVDDGNQIYSTGEVITGLSSKDAEDLVEGGYCTWHIDGTATVDEQNTDPPVGDGDEDPPPPDDSEVDGDGTNDDSDGGPDTSVTVADESPKKRR